MYHSVPHASPHACWVLNDPCPRGRWPRQCEPTSDLNSNFKRLHQTYINHISQLSKTCSLGFLHNNVPSGYHLWQDKAACPVHLSRRTCVFLFPSLTQLCVLSTGWGKPEWKPHCSSLLLLPGGQVHIPAGPNSGQGVQVPSQGSAGLSHDVRKGWEGEREAGKVGAEAEGARSRDSVADGQPWWSLVNSGLPSRPFAPSKTELINRTCPYLIDTLPFSTHSLFPIFLIFKEIHAHAHRKEHEEIKIPPSKSNRC